MNLLERAEDDGVQAVIRVLISERILVMDTDMRMWQFSENKIPFEKFQKGLDRELRRL